MNEELSRYLNPPQNWNWGTFKNNNENIIRYGWNCPNNPKALMIIAEGRTECIEEYFEFINDMNARGFACALMDWQGQGLSHRINDDTSRNHSYGFENDLDDFQKFIDVLDSIQPLKTLGKISVAHSMGGHLMTRFILQNQKTKFKCAVMIAPMMGLKPRRFIRYMARPIIATMTKFGRLNHHAIGQKPWSEKLANLYKKLLTSDPIRAAVQPSIFSAKPSHRCGGVTYGWVEAALDSIDLLKTLPELENLNTPFLFCIGEKDKIVDNIETHAIAGRMKNAEMVNFKDALHQIHRENDAIRNEFLDVFDRFIEKHLS